MAEEERSAAAKRAHRAVIAWLEESFDEDAGRYKSGMSDASIAKETGASPEYVAKVREEYFGPLKEPPEMEAIRAEMLQLHQEAERLRKDADAAAKALEAKVDALGERIIKMARSNGWRE